MKACIKTLNLPAFLKSLIIIISKTVFFLLNPRHRPLPQLSLIYAGTELIVAADSAKNNGVWFDNILSMNKHVKFLCKTAL